MTQRPMDVSVSIGFDDGSVVNVPNKLHWLSFIDPKRPTGDQFIGVVIVEAPTFDLAVLSAHMSECHPGGEAAGVELPDEKVVVPAEFRNKLLTRDQLAELETVFEKQRAAELSADEIKSQNAREKAKADKPAVDNGYFRIVGFTEASKIEFVDGGKGIRRRKTGKRKNGARKRK